jgi:CBS domain-containing protein
MIVKDVMCPRVQCVFPEVPISEVNRIMRESKLECVPVVTHDELLGIITENDISSRASDARNHVSEVTAGEVMTRGAFFCFEDEESDKAALIMREKNVHYLVVVNRLRIARVVGTISERDLSESSKSH